MAARDTKYIAVLEVVLKRGKEIQEEERQDFILRASVREIGEPRRRSFIEVGWNDVPPPQGKLDAIEWILNKVQRRLRSELPKGTKIDRTTGKLEVTGDYKKMNRVQKKMIAAISDTNRLGAYGERQLAKTRKKRRTKRGRGEV
ncbi:MAG: hypothetical protein KJO81_01590 [Gammaproteobacteria bacterium]|nr:hypothetical protein [Gammaproteobacteria bacterium]